MIRKVCVFDIEGDSLHPTKIWCLSAAKYSPSKEKWIMKSTTDYEQMRNFFLGADILVGHDIIRWDIPHIERLLGIEIKAEIVDTLALSWYLEPKRFEHGLAAWSLELGVAKIPVNNWEDLPVQKYIHRCEQDTKISCLLYDRQRKALVNLYDNDTASISSLMKYLMFKLLCAREQERSKWKLDVVKCTQVLEKLRADKESKIEELKKVMPTNKEYSLMSKPATLYKKDQSCRELTAEGLRWMELVIANDLLETHDQPIRYLKYEQEANPNSIPQIKDWLFRLGWKPKSFTYNKDNRGKVIKKVPQIRVEEFGEKVLCKSVKKLFKREPKLEALEGLSVLTHRIGVLKGFLKNVDADGYLKAEIIGFTNTLRFRHKVIVNLPSVRKLYGADIRGCLVAPEGRELCGSDMSSLEDRTKQHYIYEYDPKYVEEMKVDGFDPALDLAVVAGFLTQQQVISHKAYNLYKNKWKNALASGKKEEAKEFKQAYERETDYSFEREKGKKANYSCVYGVKGETLAIAAGITREEGNLLVKKYWERNWSVKKVAEAQKVKVCFGSLWLFNPVSTFWYSLRNEKDRFSTLNQGTGVFCFDIFIFNLFKKRLQLTGQFHDEIILTVKKGEREETENILRESIKLTNKMLKLNRALDINVQFGDSYGEIH